MLGPDQQHKHCERTCRDGDGTTKEEIHIEVNGD